MTQWISRPRAKQLVEFDDLEYQKGARPTDIDSILELHNKAYILYEVKYKDKDVPFGQRLCLSRMVDDFTAIGKEAIALICEHEVDDPEEDVTLSKCIVRECYYHGDWRQPARPVTAKEATDKLVAKWK